MSQPHLRVRYPQISNPGCKTQINQEFLSPSLLNHSLKMKPKEVFAFHCWCCSIPIKATFVHRFVIHETWGWEGNNLIRWHPDIWGCLNSSVPCIYSGTHTLCSGEKKETLNKKSGASWKLSPSAPLFPNQV